MALKIMRGDIAQMRCDAIVNPTNRYMMPGGGADLAIHKAAGDALFAMCQTLGGLEVGTVKITPGYELPCKFVIHTVGPRWQGGNCLERTLLQSCYTEALKAAKACKCKSIAFPLIASGLHGYPKDDVLQAALEVFNRFLSDNEMDIALVIYNQDEYDLRGDLKTELAAYIDEHYDETDDAELYELCDCRCIKTRKLCTDEEAQLVHSCAIYEDEQSDLQFDKEEDIFKNMYDRFSVRLMNFIDEQKMSDVECYKKANVSKQTWYKILNEEGYRPSKKTVISFAIALELDLEATQSLLASAGFILSRSSRFDLIIMYCIHKKIYDILEVEGILFKHLQETLGGK